VVERKNGLAKKASRNEKHRRLKKEGGTRVLEERK
jgi:hypothetical protein